MNGGADREIARKLMMRAPNKLAKSVRAFEQKGISQSGKHEDGME